MRTSWGLACMRSCVFTHIGTGDRLGAKRGAVGAPRRCTPKKKCAPPLADPPRVAGLGQSRPAPLHKSRISPTARSVRPRFVSGRGRLVGNATNSRGSTVKKLTLIVGIGAALL